jgi:hypothetical protein
MVQEARRLIVVAVSALLVACTSGRGGAEAQRAVADNGGWSLRLVMRRPSTGQCELFAVDRQGYACYSGGLDALNGEVKHRYPLTPEAAERYRDAMARCSWTAGTPEDLGPKGEEPLTDVTLQPRGGSERTFTLRGPQPQVDAFIAVLKPVVARRHDRVLDALPRATDGPRPAMEQGKSDGPPKATGG